MKIKYRQYVTHIPTILKMKSKGETYREIETTIGMSAAGIRWMLKHQLPDFDKRCPSCLQRHK